MPPNSIALLPFYFIRHGQTDWNVDGRGMGQKDIPLNEVGLAQARAASAVLQGKPIKLICHSPLARARRTAEILNETLRLPMLEIAELAECGWGVREGQPKGAWVDEWMQGTTPVGAEDFQAFLARALAGINRALTQPGPVLIVSHGGVYWAVQKYGRLGAFSALSNCVPLLHQPPIVEGEPWSAEPLIKPNSHVERVETARLVGFRWRTEDFNELRRLHRDARVMATLGGLRSDERTATDLESYVAHWQEHGFGLWLFREKTSGRFVGRGGLRHVIVGGNKEIEIGYALCGDEWGKGFATEIARGSVQVAFERLALPELVSFTLVDNRESRNVVEKAGLVFEREVIHADRPHALYRIPRTTAP